MVTCGQIRTGENQYKSMEQSRSGEGKVLSCVQELRRILWNLKLYYHIHNSLPLVPILSQMNPVYAPPSNLSKILFNIIVPSRSRFYKWSPSLRFFHQNPECTSSLPSPLPGQKLPIPFRNMLHFDAEQFLASHQTRKLTGYPLSAFRDLWFRIFASALHISGSAQSV